jgi:hypothetical protein
MNVSDYDILTLTAYILIIFLFIVAIILLQQKSNARKKKENETNMNEVLKKKAKTLPEWNKDFLKRGEVNCGCCSVLGTKDACSDCAEILSKHALLVQLKDVEELLKEEEAKPA